MFLCQVCLKQVDSLLFHKCKHREYVNNDPYGFDDGAKEDDSCQSIDLYGIQPVTIYPKPW